MTTTTTNTKSDRCAQVSAHKTGANLGHNLARLGKVLYHEPLPMPFHCADSD
jgi:hypothetical protein